MGQPLQLIAPLDHWYVTLRSGETVDVAAHGAKEANGLLVFVALAAGEPNFEVQLAAIPAVEIAGWSGGASFDGDFPRVGRLT